MLSADIALAAGRLAPMGALSSLVAASPPKLGGIPTLAELQKRAAELGEGVSSTIASYTSGSPDTKDGVGAKPSSTQPSRTAWFMSSSSVDNTQAQTGPPSYTEKDPLEALRAERHRDLYEPSKLQKKKKKMIGWARLGSGGGSGDKGSTTQGGLPGEEAVVAHKMQGSKVYAYSVHSNTQPSIGDIHSRQQAGAKPADGFWTWVTCRGGR